MEFLVRIELKRPRDVPAEEYEQLRQREAARTAELVDRGVMKHLWRVPGTLASLIVFEVEDATELHNIIYTMPLFPFFTVHSVEALARHHRATKPA